MFVKYNKMNKKRAFQKVWYFKNALPERDKTIPAY